jgi:membrane protein implicated in regulation of membrane protease activity
MTALFTVLIDHHLGAWLLLAAVCLAVEIHTGSGWLLWPCAAAGVTALVALSPIAGWGVESAAFAGLTLMFTVAGRGWMARRHVVHDGPDLNDQAALLVGSVGEVSTPFENGRGRVFVSGKDWAAELDPAADAPVGASIRVLALASSSRLKVARA